MTTNKTKKRAPKLRFKGFNEDWEEKKLGDVASIIGGGTPSTLKPEYWNGNINWFAPAEIGEQKEVFNSQKKITNIGLSKSSAKILPKNKTILFTSRAGIGNAAILRVDAATNQGFQSIVIDENKTNIDFLFALIPKIKQYAISHAAGSTFLEISGKELSKATINIPSLEEQQKIGALFSNLDHLIALHDAKCDNLKTLKKAMLQKMFPKKGETTPEVRFKGFDGEWEEKKLNNVLSLLKDGTHGTHKNVEDGPLLLSAKNIKDGTIKWDDSDRRISQNDYQKIHKTFKLKSGDVLLTIVGSIGETAILQNPKEITFQRSVAYLRPNNLITSDFLHTIIQSQRFQYELESRKSTSAQPGIYLNDLKNIVINFPQKIEEQQKIGAYFANLDALIAEQTQKVANLKALKKGLLQQMFV